MEPFIHQSLQPTEIIGKGWGVITKTGLKADVVIEASPVLVMNAEARQLLDQTLLHDYIFEWQPDGQQLCCVALGYLSLYNHSYNSNCEYFMDYESRIMYIKTVRAVEAGEELSINYNGDWNDSKRIWFEAMD